MTRKLTRSKSPGPAKGKPNNGNQTDANGPTLTANNQPAAIGQVPTVNNQPVANGQEPTANQASDVMKALDKMWEALFAPAVAGVTMYALGQPIPPATSLQRHLESMFRRFGWICTPFPDIPALALAASTGSLSLSKIVLEITIWFITNVVLLEVITELKLVCTSTGVGRVEVQYSQGSRSIQDVLSEWKDRWRTGKDFLIAAYDGQGEKRAEFFFTTSGLIMTTIMGVTATFHILDYLDFHGSSSIFPDENASWKTATYTAHSRGMFQRVMLANKSVECQFVNGNRLPPDFTSVLNVVRGANIFFDGRGTQRSLYDDRGGEIIRIEIDPKTQARVSYSRNKKISNRDFPIHIADETNLTNVALACIHTQTKVEMEYIGPVLGYLPTTTSMEYFGPVLASLPSKSSADNTAAFLLSIPCFLWGVWRSARTVLRSNDQNLYKKIQGLKILKQRIDYGDLLDEMGNNYKSLFPTAEIDQKVRNFKTIALATPGIESFWEPGAAANVDPSTMTADQKLVRENNILLNLLIDFEIAELSGRKEQFINPRNWSAQDIDDWAKALRQRIVLNEPSRFSEWVDWFNGKNRLSIAAKRSLLLHDLDYNDPEASSRLFRNALSSVIWQIISFGFVIWIVGGLWSSTVGSSFKETGAVLGFEDQKYNEHARTILDEMIAAAKEFTQNVELFERELIAVCQLVILLSGTFLRKDRVFIGMLVAYVTGLTGNAFITFAKAEEETPLDMGPFLLPSSLIGLNSVRELNVVNEFARIDEQTARDKTEVQVLFSKTLDSEETKLEKIRNETEKLDKKAQTAKSELLMKYVSTELQSLTGDTMNIITQIDPEVKLLRDELKEDYRALSRWTYGTLTTITQTVSNSDWTRHMLFATTVNEIVNVKNTSARNEVISFTPSAEAVYFNVATMVINVVSSLAAGRLVGHQHVTARLFAKLKRIYGRNGDFTILMTMFNFFFWLYQIAGPLSLSFKLMFLDGPPIFNQYRWALMMNQIMLASYRDFLFKTGELLVYGIRQIPWVISFENNFLTYKFTLGNQYVFENTRIEYQKDALKGPLKGLLEKDELFFRFFEKAIKDYKDPNVRMETKEDLYVYYGTTVDQVRDPVTNEEKQNLNELDLFAGIFCKREYTEIKNLSTELVGFWRDQNGNIMNTHDERAAAIFGAEDFYLEIFKNELENSLTGFERYLRTVSELVELFFNDFSILIDVYRGRGPSETDRQLSLENVKLRYLEIQALLCLDEFNFDLLTKEKNVLVDKLRPIDFKLSYKMCLLKALLQRMRVQTKQPDLWLTKKILTKILEDDQILDGNLPPPGLARDGKLNERKAYEASARVRVTMFLYLYSTVYDVFYLMETKYLADQKEYMKSLILADIPDWFGEDFFTGMPVVWQRAWVHPSGGNSKLQRANNRLFVSRLLSAIYLVNLLGKSFEDGVRYFPDSYFALNFVHQKEDDDFLGRTLTNLEKDKVNFKDLVDELLKIPVDKLKFGSLTPQTEWSNLIAVFRKDLINMLNTTFMIQSATAQQPTAPAQYTPQLQVTASFPTSEVVVQAVDEREQMKQRLLWYYQYYDPNKIKAIDGILTKAANKRGSLEGRLKAKFPDRILPRFRAAPSITLNPISSDNLENRQRLLDFFQSHWVDLVPYVDDILRLMKDKDDLMSYFQALSEETGFNV